MNTEFEYELRPIPGYEGLYYASDTGQVFSHNFSGGSRTKPLKPYKNNKGYLCVDLYRDGKRRVHKVHRLILETFKPNHGNKPCVDHIDGNKTNNHISNLRWVTAKENMNNPITVKRKSVAAKGKNNPSYDHNVYKFQNPKTGKIFIGTRYDFYTKYNLNRGDVSRLINGKLKSVKGWIFVECLTLS